MRSILCALLMFGSVLGGQPTQQDKAAASKLNSTLTALKNNSADRSILTRQLVVAMMSLADRDRLPSRATVEGFADELTGALIGRNLTNAQVTMVERSLIEVVSGSTSNAISASHLREALAALRVDPSRTHVIIKRFIAICEQVRGPDDSPVGQ